MGLGLAIVRHLVELHGGTVRGESPGEGQGATFTIRLPLMPTPVKANLAERTPEQSLDLKSLRILVSPFAQLSKSVAKSAAQRVV
ncbi:hypothetical protein H6F96_14610 [Microcoleus sp. FACHB-53]|nr:hypothetical protein [Microcoleus sp. FACHB-53]